MNPAATVSPSPVRRASICLLHILVLFLNYSSVDASAVSPVSAQPALRATSQIKRVRLKDTGEMDGIFSEHGDILLGSGGKEVSEKKGWTEEERQRCAEDLKAQGNTAFKQGNRVAAAQFYASALRILEAEAEDGTAKQQTAQVAGGEDFQCGQRVAVPVEGGGEAEVEGVIAFDNEDGTFDLVLDDGSDRDGVPREKLRILADCSAAASASMELAKACWLNAAKCAFQSNAFSIAIGLATKAIALDRTGAPAFFVRGRARLAIPTLDDAKSDLKQAVLAEPGNTEYRRVLAVCMEKIKERNIANREMAQMLLGYMRSEGVTASSNALMDGSPR